MGVKGLISFVCPMDVTDKRIFRFRISFDCFHAQEQGVLPKPFWWDQPHHTSVQRMVFYTLFRTRGAHFSKDLVNLTGPKSYFEIKVSRKVGCALTCNEVYFVSLADNSTVQFSNLLKLLSRMKNKTA